MGEHNIEEDPDCINDRICAPRKIKRSITDPSKQVIIHEDFLQKKRFWQKKDIALIRFNEPVPLFHEVGFAMSNVEPICLPWSKKDPARSIDDGINTLVTGWGKTKEDLENNVVGSKTLLKVVLPVANNECQELAKNKKRLFDIDSCITDSNMPCQICAGGANGKI